MDERNDSGGVTCPCKEMREAAAKVCSTESDLREFLGTNPIHGQDKMAQGHKAVTAGILAMLIRSLPLCGKCEIEPNAAQRRPTAGPCQACEDAAKVCESRADELGRRAGLFAESQAEATRLALRIRASCRHAQPVAPVEGKPEITRYTPVVIRASTNSAEGFSGLHPDPNGHWVEYSECRARAERLQAELDEWKRDRFKQFARAELERIWKEKAEAENALLKAAVKTVRPFRAGFREWLKEHAAAIAIAGKP